MLEYCPAARREGLMLCFSMSQYMLAFMVPSMNCRSPVPEALMQPQTMTLPPPCLTVGKTHLSLYSSSGFRKLFAGFLCIIFRRGFLLGRQPCRPIWCSVRRMVWALTGWPPTPSTSAAMLAALTRLFPKHNLWIWRWARALNFFGRPWWGLFWVEPVLLNRCMVLATVLQLSFRVLAIFLKPTPSLCRACEKCEGCTYFCEILYMCIYIYIYIKNLR